MFIPTNCVLAFAAFLLFASHMVEIHSSIQEGDNSTDFTDPCEKAGEECYCFFAYIKEGSDNKVFKWHEASNGTVPNNTDYGCKVCEKRCETWCDDWMDPLVNSYLCEMIDADYNSNEEDNIGCFAHMGPKEELCISSNHSERSWNKIKAPRNLCCNKEKNKCSAYGPKYVYNSNFDKCLKELDDGCIQGVDANDDSPPVCCLTDSTGQDKTYGCQPLGNSAKPAYNVTC